MKDNELYATFWIVIGVVIGAIILGISACSIDSDDNKKELLLKAPDPAKLACAMQLDGHVYTSNFCNKLLDKN